MKHLRMIGAAIGASAMSHGWYRTDDDVPMYRVAAGDTLGQLATDYLDDYGRYMEIWYAQPDSRRANGNPNLIYAGESLFMPDDAVSKAIALGYLEASAPDLELPDDGGGAVIPPFIPMPLPDDGGGPQVIVGPITPVTPPATPDDPGPDPIPVQEHHVPYVKIAIGAGALALAYHAYAKWKKSRPAPARVAAKRARAR